MKKLIATIVAGAFLFSGCMEPYNGCLLYAVKKKGEIDSGAEISAQKYVGPHVSTHLLAIKFNDGSGHVALIIKGDYNFFAWDDSPHGGRELFFTVRPKLYNGLPDAIAAAQAAFPEKKVELAWWMDELKNL